MPLDFVTVLLADGLGSQLSHFAERERLTLGDAARRLLIIGLAEDARAEHMLAPAGDRYTLEDLLENGDHV